MDLSSMSSNGTIADQSPAISGVETLDTTASLDSPRNNIPDSCRTTGHQQAMASVPGGPPMASGAANVQDTSRRDRSPQVHSQDRTPGARSRGPRVQLFQEQQASMSSPDRSVGASSAAPGQGPPPPDVVQSRNSYRPHQEVFVDSGGASVTFDTTRAGQRAFVPSSGTGQGQEAYQGLPQPLRYVADNNGQPEGQEAVTGSAKLPASERTQPMNRSEYPTQGQQSDAVKGFNQGNHSLYQELRTAIINTGYNGTASGSRPLQGMYEHNPDAVHVSAPSSSTPYNTNNIQILAPVDGQDIQVPDPPRSQLRFHQLRDADHETLHLRLSPDEPGTGNDSVESGMYLDHEDHDLSEEFLPLENEAPEGAGSSSQSNEDDLEYEDNTEVDQDVVLQPEADQTSYDDNDEVEDHVSREAHFIPVVPAGGGRQPMQGGIGAGAMYQRSGRPQQNFLQDLAGTYPHNSTGLSAFSVQPFPQQQLSQSHQQQYQLQQPRQCSPVKRRDTHDAGNGNARPEEDQAMQQEDQSKNAKNPSGRQSNQEPRNEQYDTNAMTRSSLTRDRSPVPREKSPLKSGPRSDQDRPTGPHKPSAGGRSTNEDPSGRGPRSPHSQAPPSTQASQPKPRSSSSGTHAGKQHVGSGAIAKVLKPSQPQTSSSVRRSKIRTVPPKSAGVNSTKVGTSSSKTRTQHTTARNRPVSKSSRSTLHQPCPRAAASAKSPSRVPPQRLAPSGGDSSTAPPSQSQVQDNLAQAIHGGHYMLPTQLPYQSVSQQQPAMYIDSSNIQVPSRDQNRDGADGFLRPNPIGETDSGARVLPATSGQQTSHPMIAFGPLNHNPPLSLLTGHVNLDGDGDEAGSFHVSVPSSQLGAVSHSYLQPQGSFRAMIPIDRQVPGTSLNTPQDPNVPWLNPSVTSSGVIPQRSNQNLYQQGPFQQAYYSHLQAQPSSLPIVYSTNFYSQHALGAADSTHISTLASGAQGQASRQNPDAYGAWDRSLELSPISRASGATDRVQATSQASPSPAGSGRETQQNHSFGSNGSERTVQNEQSLLTTDIVGMEQLRGQIHNMLKMTSQVLPEKGVYDQTNDENRSTPGSRLVEETNSVSLADRALSDLDMDSILNLPSRFYAGQGGASSQQHDVSSLMADRQNLQETLEKEKFRRKHCEKQIGDLQSKVLELQQQLAVAVSTDRKKDLMIEQLDKTLAQLVEGWKKKEAEKQKAMHTLQEENTSMKTKQRQQQEVLDKFERDLTETVDQLAQEQQRSKVIEEEHLDKIASQQQEIGRLSQILEKEHQRAISLDADVHSLTSDRDGLRAKLDDTIQHYNQDKETWDDKERDYLQKMEEITDNHHTKMDEEMAKFMQQSKKCQDLQHVLTSCQNDLQKVQLELETTHRERESLKVQMGLLEAKSESQLRKLEADLHSQFEKQLSERSEEDRLEAAEREQEAQERHKRQVLELTQRHQQESEAQLQRHQGELWRADDARKREIREKEDKIELLQQEVEDLKVNNKRLEQQRSEMTLKLQSMMQSHCNEALRLLQVGSQALAFGKDGTFSSIYSGIAALREPNNSSLASSSTAPTVVQNVSTTTTSVSVSNLRTSVLEAATKAQGGSTNVERYLHSLDGPQFDSHFSVAGLGDSGSILQRADDQMTFRPLSDLLNSSLASELTQVPINNESPPPSVLDTSHMTSISMAPSQQYPNTSTLHNSMFPEDSRLMSLVQSLPTTQTRTAVATASVYSPVVTATHDRTAFRPFGLPESPSQMAEPSQSTSYSRNPKYGSQHQSSFSFAGEPEKSTSQSTTLNNGPTIMLHPPVQRDHVHTHNASVHSGSSGSSVPLQGPSERAPPRSQFEAVPQSSSMNTTASSDWGYPTTDGSRPSLLSHILQQHLHSNTTEDDRSQPAQSLAHLHQNVNRLTESPADLSNVTEKFDEHESRQNELQHYIRMLLQRSPSSTGPGSTDSPDQTIQPAHPEEASTPPPKVTPGKLVAFTKSTLAGGQAGVAPGGPTVSAGSSVTVATTGHSTSAQDTLGTLSPHQVGEISRLLGLYGRNKGPDGETMSELPSQPPVEELLAYLKNLQIRNESLSSPQEQHIPTRDMKSRTPPQQGQSRPRAAGPRQASPTRPGQSQNKAKKNLEQTYQQPSSKHVIKIPSAVDTSQTKPQPSATKQLSTAASVKAPTQLQAKPSINGQQQKKPVDRKTAPNSKQPGKGSSAWK